MSKQKSIAKFLTKAKKRNTFPNITTAYALLSSDGTIGPDATTTIEKNNRKAP